MIVGIDPGINGALAAIYANLPLVLDVPKIGKEPDYTEWAKQWLPQLSVATHIWIERVSARPGQGVTSMFSFGERYGFVIGLVAASGRPYSFVRPQEWRKGVGIPKGAEKGASRLRAKQLWPDANLFDRVKDDGRAEASLIAFYGTNQKGAG